MFPGWIISTASCFSLHSPRASLSHIPDLSLISLWELQSLPPAVWLWARQAEFSVPGTVIVVKSCSVDRRLFCCLEWVFPTTNVLEIFRSTFRSWDLTLYRPWYQKDLMSLTLLGAKVNQEGFHFEEYFFKTLHILSCFCRSPYYFVRSVWDSCHTAEPLLCPQV